MLRSIRPGTSNTMALICGVIINSTNGSSGEYGATVTVVTAVVDHLEMQARRLPHIEFFVLKARDHETQSSGIVVLNRDKTHLILTQLPSLLSCFAIGLQSLLADASPECVDVMVGLLEYDPDARLSARQALKHPYFKDLRDEDKRQARAAAAMAAAVAEPEEEIVEETGPSSLASALKSKLRISRRGTKTTRSVKVRAPAAAAAGGVTDASQESMQGTLQCDGPRECLVFVGGVGKKM